MEKAIGRRCLSLEFCFLWAYGCEESVWPVKMEVHATPQLSSTGGGMFGRAAPGRQVLQRR